MTLTIKEASPLNLTKPGSATGTFESNSDRTTRSNPVCLEVAVTIRSLPGEKGEASSGSAQTAQEESRTVIVFDNGAVLRLSGNFPPGQAIILTNSRGKEVVCRVVSARNLPNVKGYIEVEFQEPIIDFWGIHRPADPANVVKPASAVVMQPQALPKAQIVPSEPPPSLPPVPARMTPSVPVKDALAGNTALSHDVAGPDRTPVTVTPAKIPEAPLRFPASKNAVQLKQEIVEAPRSYVPANAAGAASDLTSLSGSWETTPSPSIKPSSSNDILGEFSDSPDAIPGTPSSKYLGKTPLFIAGAAVVFIGFGTGLFFMHRQSPVTVAPVPVAALTQSVTPKRPVPANIPEPPVAAPASTSQPPSASVLSSNSESLSQTPRHSVVDADVVQPDRPVERPQPSRNLKMKAPNVESQSGRLVDSSVPNIEDVAAISGVNGIPGVGVIPTVSHANNPPPPPGTFAGLSSSVKNANQPKVVSSPHPVYPPMAKQANVEGDVLVSAEIDAAGNVVQAKAVSGPMFLQQAAVDAVRQWKYEPATLDARPSSTHINIKIQFRLK